MNTVTSKDGTRIAFEQSGKGPAVILVVGAFNERATGAPLAQSLEPHFTVFNYDRRGRGDSSDTAPYAIEREIEDLQALIAKAGGSAWVFGYSSGAILALRECFEIQSVVRNRVYTKRNRPTAIDFEPTKVGFAVSCSDFNRPKAISKHSLREYAAYGKPIYVTENGLFDLGDETQARYLVLHLVQVQRAIAGGVPVKGYFYWTLVDNFEWAEGFTARFGLYHLDVPTQKRTPRPSAEIYKRIACDGRIADELIEKYGHTD